MDGDKDDGFWSGNGGRANSFGASRWAWAFGLLAAEWEAAVGFLCK